MSWQDAALPVLWWVSIYVAYALGQMRTAHLVRRLSRGILCDVQRGEHDRALYVLRLLAGLP